MQMTDVLLAERREDVEGIVNIADEYEKEQDLKFSERICKVLVFCSEDLNQWLLGDNVLEIVDKYVCLGMEANKEVTGGGYKEKLMMGRQGGCQG